MVMYILAFIVFAALWEPIESGYSNLLINVDFQQGLPHDDASFEEMGPSIHSLLEHFVKITSVKWQA